MIKYTFCRLTPCRDNLRKQAWTLEAGLLNQGCVMSKNHYHELAISGMHCASCIPGIEKALRAVPGVEQATASFVEMKAEVKGDADSKLLIEAIASEGYEAVLISADSEDDAKATLESKLFKKRMWYAGVAAVVGFGLLILGYLGLLPNFEGGGANHWFWGGVVSVTFGVLWFSGGMFFSGAWQGFLQLRANMDTLIAMGTGAAWLYSSVVVLVPQVVPALARHAYFDTAMIILAFINLGQALEQRAKGKTSEAIKRLTQLQPKTARVVHKNEEKDVPIAQLEVGDIIRVRPGEQIPIDGVIIEGHSTIDESMLTGESMPVSKKENDEVVGGALNKTGSFLFKATRVGAETALSRIIQLVKQAQGSKPQIGKLADKIAGVFVPSVMLIAIVAGIIWAIWGPEPKIAYILVAMVSTLLIACPCALGLATPISVMLGVGNAARKGILIRNGEALQRASQLTTIVLDKTGTVTEGHPALSRIVPARDWHSDELLQLAASAEQGSEHPLAEAIVNAAKEKNITLLNVKAFSAVPGHGIEAEVEGRKIYLGNDKLMKKYGIAYVALNAEVQKLADEGQTPMYFGVDGELAGVIAVADPIKEDSKEAIARFKKKKLKVVMITGDNQRTAKAVAKAVGIDHFVAEVLPDDKSREVARLQGEEAVVAMVGDGVNDAPALARADVGFAIGTGTDVAIESSDVALMRGSLHGVADAIDISHATLRNIKQNLFGAFFYNSLGIPVAAGVLYPFTGWLLNPMIAGIVMALSSLTVVTNALRLRQR